MSKCYIFKFIGKHYFSNCNHDEKNGMRENARIYNT